MNKIAIYLNRHLTGNVYDKVSILEAYASDSSALKIKPRFVAIPESTSDICKIACFSNQLAEKKYPLPLSVRGAGLSRSGADLSSGVVLSMEKMNRLRELDAHDRLVCVQAGISLGELNAILAPHGLVLPISAHPKETIGSLIANAPRDRFSHKYGGIMNYVDRVEFVTASGVPVQTLRLSKHRLNQKKQQKDVEGTIYNRLERLILDNYELVNQQNDNIRFGYPGLQHIRRLGGRVFDLMPVFFGSEGSLGVITEAILRLEPIPARPHHFFAVFNTLKPALEFAEFAASLAPLTVEFFDTRIFKSAEPFGKKPDLLTRKLNDGYLVLTSFNDQSRIARRKVQACKNFLPKSAYAVTETLKNSLDFSDFEPSLLSFLNNAAHGERVNVTNDFYVPISELGSLSQFLKDKEIELGRPLELYGSYLTGVFSVRPDFRLDEVEERRKALMLLRDLNETLTALGGNLAGGYPEGRLKSIIMYPGLDKESTELIKAVKNIFDPNHIFAPGVKSDFDTRSTVRHLRTETNLGIIE